MVFIRQPFLHRERERDTEVFCSMILSAIKIYVTSAVDEILICNTGRITFKGEFTKYYTPTNAQIIYYILV